MTSIRLADTVDPFRKSTLLVGRNGAETTTSIDPSHNELYIRNAGELHGVSVYEGRDGDSDVQVTGSESRPKRTGFKAQLEHYGNNAGELSINGTRYTAQEFDGRHLVVQNPKTGATSAFDIFEGDVSIQFGKVNPSFESVELPASVRVFFLDNVSGKDQLTVRAQLAAAADVGYSVTVSDASKQDAIKAELKGFVTVRNDTEVDLKDMALTLRSNEVQPRGRGGFNRSMALETVASVADASESAGGVIELPVRSGGVNVAAGQTNSLPFTAALNGTPNEAVQFIPVTLKQSLDAHVGLTPDAAEWPAQKMSPNASYEMNGTNEAQPAGDYLITSGSEKWGAASTHNFTPEKTELKIPGASFPQIKLQVSTEVMQRDATPNLTQGLPTANRVNNGQTVNYSVKQTIEAKSTSEHDRKVSLQVSPALEGVDQVTVTTDGPDIAQVIKVDKETRTATVELDIPAGESIKVYVHASGHRQER